MISQRSESLARPPEISGQDLRQAATVDGHDVFTSTLESPLQPDNVELCAETRYTSGSTRSSDRHGCVSADIAYDAEPPQLAAALRGPNSLSPSVLTLTCLDPWRQCQVLAECRNKSGTPHQGLLPTISPGATAVHSATTLANNLTPAGFLTATADNPGHCQFHSTHQLSVLHQAD